MWTSSRNPTKAFYEDLSDVYHLLFDDWDAAVVEQGKCLDNLIRQSSQQAPCRMLDATCGIGTQAIGLALRGYDVVGADLSSSALARAEAEARRFGVDLTTKAADLRTLSTVIRERFPLILVLDNSLAHLQEQADLIAAAGELAGRLEPAGLLLGSMRDYDALRLRRPKMMSTRVMGSRSERRIAFQVWDWEDDGEHYALAQYIVQHDPSGVKALAFECRLRAVSRAAIAEAFFAAGFDKLQWIEPRDSGFCQPVFVASR